MEQEKRKEGFSGMVMCYALTEMDSTNLFELFVLLLGGLCGTLT